MNLLCAPFMVNVPWAGWFRRWQVHAAHTLKHTPATVTTASLR